MNDKIRAREVRLVDPDGGQIGLKSIEEARWLADQLGLDLVEVAADARPPVVRMMDYGKFKYEQSVKAREARKKQTRTVIKEVQFRPKISDNDFAVKRKRVERFLGEGDKVKVTMRFRGREVTHPEIGRAILDRLLDQVEEQGTIETPPKFEGRQMVMVIAPLRTQRHREPEPAAASEQPTKEDSAAPETETSVTATAADDVPAETPAPATSPQAETAQAETAQAETAQAETAQAETAQAETAES